MAIGRLHMVGNANIDPAAGHPAGATIRLVAWKMEMAAEP